MSTIVNFSSGAWYPKGQTRLIQSCIAHNQSPFIMYNDYDGIKCLPHYKNPYAFKIYSILHAVEHHNARKVLWIDSSGWLNRPIDEIESILDGEQGLFLEYGGEGVGNWTNDRTISYFNTTRDDLMNVPIVVAGVCGFNLDNPFAQKIFNEWKSACDNGMFVGKWDNSQQTESLDDRCKGHRHDLSSLSIIAHQNKVNAFAPNTYLQYIYPNLPIKESSIVLLQGM
jgi:hypothetical protein